MDSGTHAGSTGIEIHFWQLRWGGWGFMYTLKTALAEFSMHAKLYWSGFERACDRACRIMGLS